MFCNKCGAQIPDDSHFCNKCGAAESPDPAAALAPPGPAPAPGLPLQPPPKDEPEQEVWRGRMSAMAMGHWWILWVLWVVGLTYLYFAHIEKRSPLINYTLLGLIALPALWILGRTLLRMLTVRYRLTTQRLQSSMGFIAREMLELELVRVDDVAVEQNLIQRIFNVGTVTVIATDVVEPRIDLKGIPRPIEVKEMIRSGVQKRRNRVVNLRQV